LEETNLLLHLSVVNDESNVLSSSLLVVVLSIISGVLGSLEEDSFESLIEKRAKKSVTKLDLARREGRDAR